MATRLCDVPHADTTDLPRYKAFRLDETVTVRLRLYWKDGSPVLGEDEEVWVWRVVEAGSYTLAKVEPVSHHGPDLALRLRLGLAGYSQGEQAVAPHGFE